MKTLAVMIKTFSIVENEQKNRINLPVAKKEFLSTHNTKLRIAALTKPFKNT